MVKYSSCFIWLVLFAEIAVAQRYNFENYSVDQGLAQSEIYSICQDSRGALWIGTYGGGIVRFDGFTFKTYREENGLINNYVLTISEDRSGILWIGTEKGLCTYDGTKFRPFSLGKNISQTSVSALLQDKAGNLWIATFNQGLFKYTAGKASNPEALSGLVRRVKNKGFTDAFIVAFNGKERITIAEAKKLISESLK